MAQILVVDDEYEVRVGLRQMLERAGYEVMDAPDGKAGMRLFREDPTDVVITEIFMPEKSGLEVIQEIRADCPKAKIIAISGIGIRDELDIVSLSKQLGATHAFEKPLDLKELQGAVEELLGKDQ